MSSWCLIMLNLQGGLKVKDLSEDFSDSKCLKCINQNRLSYVILNLYGPKQGYSIGLRKYSDNKELETVKISYEHRDILDFIDNEEIPPMFLDVFEELDHQQESPLFFKGAIFMEIRDHRDSGAESESIAKSYFVRLKPTNETIFSYLKKLTNSTNMSQETRNSVEAKLVHEYSEPLRLDPNPKVTLLSNRFHLERDQIKSQKKIQSLINQNSLIKARRIAKFKPLPAPKGLELFDFLAKRKWKAVKKETQNKSKCDKDQDEIKSEL